MKKILSIFSLVLLLVAAPGAVALAADYEEDLLVDAIWYPIDWDTGEVIAGLEPLNTHPIFERGVYSEEGTLEISYNGLQPLDPDSFATSNFLTTGNTFFSDRFHRIVAQGLSWEIAQQAPYSLVNSAVVRVVYGTVDDSNYTEGLQGTTQVLYQAGETMELYLPVIAGNLTNVTFVEDELELQRPQTLNAFLEAIRLNIVEYNYQNVVAATLDDYIANDILSFETDDITLDQVFLYRYQGDPSTDGAFLDDGGAYLNAIGQDDAWLQNLEPGYYEVVIPIFWQDVVSDWIGGSETFSRYTYRFDDTIHFTLLLEKRDGQGVTVKYVDSEGNELEKSDVIPAGKVGETWEAQAIVIPGWTLASAQGAQSGVFTDEPQVVVFEYKPVAVPDDGTDKAQPVPGKKTPATGDSTPYKPIVAFVTLIGSLLVLSRWRGKAHTDI